MRCKPLREKMGWHLTARDGCDIILALTGEGNSPVFF